MNIHVRSSVGTKQRALTPTGPPASLVDDAAMAGVVFRSPVISESDVLSVSKKLQVHLALNSLFTYCEVLGSAPVIIPTGYRFHTHSISHMDGPEPYI